MTAYLDSALWALGRGTGVVALVMFTVSLVLGIMTRSGRAALGVGRFGLSELHRTAALTGTALIVLHVGALFFDPFAQLRLVDFVVPFLGSYRPIWLGLGTLAVDVLLVVTVVSLLRERVGPRVFRAVHWTTYALWPMALVHALGNGSDNGTAWLRAVAGVCTAAVGVAIAWRVSEGYVERGRVRIPRSVPR
jgi:sulfoxide reductase heme-binding subunit YedZ